MMRDVKLEDQKTTYERESIQNNQGIKIVFSVTIKQNDELRDANQTHCTTCESISGVTRQCSQRDE